MVVVVVVRGLSQMWVTHALLGVGVTNYNIHGGQQHTQQAGQVWPNWYKANQTEGGYTAVTCDIGAAAAAAHCGYCGASLTQLVENTTEKRLDPSVGGHLTSCM